MDMLGTILIIIGIAFILFGAISILLLPDFYIRLLVCSQIDTVGFLILLVGILTKYFNDIYRTKILFIMIIAFTINPISNYAIGRSAYLRGEEPKKEI
ncbi:MAG: monovalent cation/H(+) antiporter subunit G [Clostridia bacterium]|jgi:multicomponent Na+:H+ antiporter subunit G|nr:monovalent cation/H(+) antiporter subunit G [Clostridia bacterium]